METTLTLEDDLASQLTELAHNRRKTFTEIVNETLRRGLSAPPAIKRPVAVKVFDCPLGPDMDPKINFNKLYDELETDDFLAKLSKFEKGE